MNKNSIFSIRLNGNENLAILLHSQRNLEVMINGKKVVVVLPAYNAALTIEKT